MTDKALAVVICIVVLLIVGGLLYRNTVGETLVEPVPLPVAAAVSDKTETRVRVRVTRCMRDYGRTGMTGVVQNTGNVDLHYVTVRTIWKNDAGAVIGSDTLYALNDGLLPPGGSIDFEDVSELTTATRCNAEAVDWW